MNMALLVFLGRQVRRFWRWLEIETFHDWMNTFVVLFTMAVFCWYIGSGEYYRDYQYERTRPRVSWSWGSPVKVCRWYPVYRSMTYRCKQRIVASGSNS